jgi:hypothetical protein
VAILWYTQKIKVKTKSAKKLIMSDNNNNNSCNSNDDQQSFGSLAKSLPSVAEFEGSLSEESKNQFRDAQLIYWKDSFTSGALNSVLARQSANLCLYNSTVTQ